MMNQVESILAEHKVLPVVSLDRVELAVPLCQTLVDAGLPLAEITLRTECALECISAAAGVDGMCLGAGTVLNVEQAQAASRAGAQFIVSPGFDEETVQWCVRQQIPVFPGIATASEVQRAFNLGLRCVKFFPAEVQGGILALRALSAPFPSMRFMPTGGVNLSNLNTYLEFSKTLAVGGSWLAKREFLAEGNFQRVAEIVQQTLELVHTRTIHEN